MDAATALHAMSARFVESPAAGVDFLMQSSSGAAAHAHVSSSCWSGVLDAQHRTNTSRYRRVQLASQIMLPAHSAEYVELEISVATGASVCDAFGDSAARVSESYRRAFSLPSLGSARAGSDSDWASQALSPRCLALFAQRHVDTHMCVEVCSTEEAAHGPVCVPMQSMLSRESKLSARAVSPEGVQVVAVASVVIPVSACKGVGCTVTGWVVARESEVVLPAPLLAIA
jgi:hypothetical protein